MNLWQNKTKNRRRKKCVRISECSVDDIFDKTKKKNVSQREKNKGGYLKGQQIKINKFTVEFSKSNKKCSAVKRKD